MKQKKLIWNGLKYATGEVIYVFLVATLMRSGNSLFGQEDKFITPVAVLLLFVLSASISGYLILGNPILLYLDGKKKEALKLFGFTLGWISIWIIVFFTILMILKK